MPQYEYKCPECGREQTFLMKFNDPHPICACKEGDPPQMQKQISRSSFHLKGGCWYKDGYTKGKRK